MCYPLAGLDDVGGFVGEQLGASRAVDARCFPEKHILPGGKGPSLDGLGEVAGPGAFVDAHVAGIAALDLGQKGALAGGEGATGAAMLELPLDVPWGAGWLARRASLGGDVGGGGFGCGPHGVHGLVARCFGREHPVVGQGELGPGKWGVPRQVAGDIQPCGLVDLQQVGDVDGLGFCGLVAASFVQGLVAQVLLDFMDQGLLGVFDGLARRYRQQLLLQYRAGLLLPAVLASHTVRPFPSGIGIPLIVHVLERRILPRMPTSVSEESMDTLRPGSLGWRRLPTRRRALPERAVLSSWI